MEKIGYKRYAAKVLRPLGPLNPFRYIKRLDRYIVGKFIGTYIFALLLIISIAIVIDFNENLSNFTEYNAPWRAHFDLILNK